MTNAARRVRVGDVLDLKRHPVEIDPFDEYIPIGIRSFGRGIFHYEPTSGGELSKLRFFEVRPNELVLSNIKAWEGAIAVSTKDERGCIASNRFLTYVPKAGAADVSYLRYFFLSDAGLPLIQRASPGSADRNRTLAIDRFEALEIPLPSIDEQRRIAASLESVETGSRRVLFLADQAEGLTRATLAVLTATEGLPVRLGDVLTRAERPVTVEPTREYQMLGVRSHGAGPFHAGVLDGSETSYKTLRGVCENDFVFPKLMAWEGAFAVVPSTLDEFFVSPEFCVFEADLEQVDISYLGYLFRVPATWQHVAGRSIGTNVRRRRLHPDNFLAQDVLLPPLSEQKRIAADLSKLDAASERRRLQRERVASLRLAVMNRAFGRPV